MSSERDNLSPDYFEKFSVKRKKIVKIKSPILRIAVSPFVPLCGYSRNLTINESTQHGRMIDMLLTCY